MGVRPRVTLAAVVVVVVVAVAVVVAGRQFLLLRVLGPRPDRDWRFSFSLGPARAGPTRGDSITAPARSADDFVAFLSGSLRWGTPRRHEPRFPPRKIIPESRAIRGADWIDDFSNASTRK